MKEKCSKVFKSFSLKNFLKVESEAAMIRKMKKMKKKEYRNIEERNNT